MIYVSPKRAKIGALEGLRGLMAWWVVLGHLSVSFDWSLPLVDNNTLAVDVFIVLSGFVIARLIDRKAEGYAPFITRRAFRLFPLYLVVLAVSVSLLWVQLGAWAEIPIRNEKTLIA
jgi:peptidoglycan/LPS O-acetylase OafA/YrhL